MHMPTHAWCACVVRVPDAHAWSTCALLLAACSLTSLPIHSHRQIPSLHAALSEQLRDARKRSTAAEAACERLKHDAMSSAQHHETLCERLKCEADKRCEVSCRHARPAIHVRIHMSMFHVYTHVCMALRPGHARPAYTSLYTCLYTCPYTCLY